MSETINDRGLHLMRADYDDALTNDERFETDARPSWLAHDADMHGQGQRPRWLDGSPWPALAVAASAAMLVAALIAGAML